MNYRMKYEAPEMTLICGRPADIITLSITLGDGLSKAGDGLGDMITWG